MSKVWPNFTKEHPCPICNHFDWTCRAGDKKIICMRVESSHPADDGGWYHDLGDAPKLVMPIKRVVVKTGLDFENIWRGMIKNAEINQRFANDLGVSLDAVQSLQIAWSVKHDAMATTMRDGDNKIIGIQLRTNPKKCVTGSRLGLFIPQIDPQRIAYICEGASDCASLLTMGLYAVGRPSCNTGAEMLKALFKRLNIWRVVIVADNDSIKSTGKRPGYQGAEKLKKQLGLSSVIWTPSSPCKDVRELLNKVGAETARKMIEIGIKEKAWTK